MADEEQLHGVRITTDGARASVSLDGVDLSDRLTSYTVQHQAGRPPLVVLYVKPGKQIAFDGVAQVVVAREDPRPLAEEFLAGVDPDQLDAAVLARDDLDGAPGELTRGLLRTLMEQARPEVPQ